ncbi:MAG: hypothetical protein L3J58_00815 [Emcibacter sp.]|nr:hypothetical protein [Emcibacter sp.]
MHIILILAGFIFLLYVIARFMQKSNSPRTKKIIRYSFAAVFGLLAFFFLVIAKLMPIGGILGLLAFLSAQGGLWRFFGSGSDANIHSDNNMNRKGNAVMTREEALDILGLSGNPDVDTIKNAHHKMMLKMHPDQGGSDYIASKLNQARDMLL